MIAISPTDIEWFNYLKVRHKIIDEFNFWTPTPWNIKKLKQGEKFYFLLKKPYRKIGGYGTFKYYINMTIQEAWKKFGKSNGVKNLEELINKTSNYVLKNTKRKIDLTNYKVGCIILEKPRFFNDSEFFSVEEMGYSFSKNIVKLKYFQDDFDNVSTNYIKTVDFNLLNENEIEYTTSKSKYRIGQRQFREQLIDIYQRRCAISGETSLSVLEAAHIQQFINQYSNQITNGILLRIDLHRLFDEGLITITSDYKIIVSKELASKNYWEYHNQQINLPQNKIYHPNKYALEYHNKFIFRG